MFKQTNQTQYLKPNNLSTVIIDQAMMRSRIRQPHPTSKIKPMPGAEGLLSFPDKTTQLFLYLILTLEQMNQTQYLKPNNLSTLIIGQATKPDRVSQTE